MKKRKKIKISVVNDLLNDLGIKVIIAKFPIIEWNGYTYILSEKVINSPCDFFNSCKDKYISIMPYPNGKLVWNNRIRFVDLSSNAGKKIKITDADFESPEFDEKYRQLEKQIKKLEEEYKIDWKDLRKIKFDI